MNEYMKNAIVNHAWHQFLYGYNGEERKKILEGMASSYPVKIDSDDPFAIYIDDFSLPMVESSYDVDVFQKKTIAREYFSVVLVDRIIEETISRVELDLLNERMTSFIDAVNRLMISSGHDNVKNIVEFSQVLKDAKKFYSNEYVKMIMSGKFQGDISSLRLGFLDLNFFYRYYKKAIGLNNHISVIIDQQKVGATISQQAVNGIVNMRCAGELAMCVACNPEEWKTYYDLNGQMIEYIHDYSAVELDDCYAQYVKKLKFKMTKED